MQSLALALPGSQVHISVCVFLVTLCVLLVRFKTGKWLHSVIVVVVLVRVEINYSGVVEGQR